MDRISELPDFIVHHILSFINTPPDLVRISVLSKKWFDLTASFPNLDLNQGYLCSRINYFKYVEYTISRFCHQNVPAHRFLFDISVFEPAELDIVNRCLELVFNKGVREFEISVHTVSPMPKYRLPNTLLSVSVLKSLTIFRCELPSSLVVDEIRFRSLLQLTLTYISIDDEGINHLTTSCPLLQELKISGCLGFKRFCVYGHQNLQNVEIDYEHQVERIDIEAPNLSTLLVGSGNKNGAPKMNLASCKKLTTVSYYGYPSTNSIGFLSNFPFVETMFLATGYKCNNLKLSSHSLQTLVLHSFCDLEVIEFNAPNLVVFDYYYTDRVLWPMVRRMTHDPTHLKACMRCYLDFGIIDAIWFQKLRLLLDKESGFKVENLFIYASRPRTTPFENFIELENLKAIKLQPYELQHVELQLDTRHKSVDHLAFVDALLWCCRPKSLTISFSIGLQRYDYVRRDFEVPGYFVWFTYEKLLEQEDEGHTNIQIVLPFSKPLMALHPGEKAITFMKEEGTR